MNGIQPSPAITTVTTVVIGAGQAGLATSYELAQRGVDHVVLERGKVANSWRTERWDSLRLLTPNWQNRLPGYRYTGSNPNDFMTTPELVQLIQHYAKTISAPVHDGVIVTGVDATENGYRVTTNIGQWQCRSLVIASGAFNIPNVPAVSKAIPASVALDTSKFIAASSFNLATIFFWPFVNQSSNIFSFFFLFTIFI